jgi:hypothetical protein
MYTAIPAFVLGSSERRPDPAFVHRENARDFLAPTCDPEAGEVSGGKREVLAGLTADESRIHAGNGTAESGTSACTEVAPHARPCGANRSRRHRKLIAGGRFGRAGGVHAAER